MKITFAQATKKYLKYSQANEQSKRTYARILDKHWSELNPLPLSQINTEMVLDILLDKDISDKYTNQILIPLRGIFDTAVMLKYISHSPVQLKNRKLQTRLPDPFTKKEMECILNWLKDNTHLTCYLFYEISFWTGLRPCELLALTWEDIQNDRILVYKTRLRGVEKQSTKTRKMRYVLLNDRSHHAINQIPRVSDYLIVTPDNHEPYSDNSHLRHRFNHSLKANKIRKRPSYNTRHTYATLLLMAGANPTFVANQLGHSLVMLNTHYARWLYSEEDKKQIAKLNT